MLYSKGLKKGKTINKNKNKNKKQKQKQKQQQEQANELHFYDEQYY